MVGISGAHGQRYDIRKEGDPRLVSDKVLSWCNGIRWAEEWARVWRARFLYGMKGIWPSSIRF
jgi:hypothetical protein